jgi:hypothetical protein
MVLWIPVQIGFELVDADFSEDFIFFNKYMIILLLMIDIFIVKTNTAVYHDGKIICDRYSVIGLYFKGAFLTDVITTSSLILAGIVDQPLISLIFVSRYSDIIKIY